MPNTRRRTGAYLLAEGRRVNLRYDSRRAFDATQPAGLANEAGDRVWELPDDVRAELERYGFDFTPN